MHDFIKHCLSYFRRRSDAAVSTWDELGDAMHAAMRGMSPADRSDIIRMLRILYGQALNQRYDQAVNGEFWVIEQLAPHLKHVMDVGANEGVWSEQVRRLAPTAKIHAFEPVPAVFAILEQKFAVDDRIRLNRVGLHERDGSVTLHVLDEDHRLSSIHKKPGGTPNAVDCAVMRGDAYMRDQQIARVDLLKIDCEGSEPYVLKGFADAFAQGRVMVCQVEYGVENSFNRWLLRDMYDFFYGHGLYLGRLFPDGVDFRHYSSYTDENFIGGNYIACHGAREDLMQLLRGRGAPASSP